MAILSADQTAPGRQWKAITPSDTASMGNCRAIYVGGDGNLALVDNDDNVVVFTGILAGTILPLAAKRVNATNTTATLLVAIY